MTSVFQKRVPGFRRSAAGVAAAIVFLLAIAQTQGQSQLTYEELMRRARGLPATNSTIKTATNSPAVSSTPPKVAVAPPAKITQPSTLNPQPKSINPQPSTLNQKQSTNPQRTSTKKTKGPVYSNPPPTNSVSSAPLPSPPAQTQDAPVAQPLAGDSISTNAMESLDEKYRLAIGDRLSFRIIEDEEDPKPLFVTDSGELEVPYVGRFRGVGKTCRELARALKAELEKEYYHRATVIIAVDLMARSRGKIYFAGAVRIPNPIDMPADETLTVSKAILRAGGFSDFADKRNVKVNRKAATPDGQDKIFKVNVEEILEKGKTDSDMPLEPDDLIYVPEKLIRF